MPPGSAGSAAAGWTGRPGALPEVSEAAPEAGHGSRFALLTAGTLANTALAELRHLIKLGTLLNLKSSQL